MEASRSSNYSHEPQFTQDWFSYNIGVWQQLLAGFSGKPNLRFLEIGSFEGRSTVWLLQNILTDISSNITCIDTFEGGEDHSALGIDCQDIETRFRLNTSLWKSQVHVLKGYSHRQLDMLHGGGYTFDFIYVDGSHATADVLIDAVMCDHVLKRDGVMIFDDYLWDAMISEDHRPGRAIDAFLMAFRHRYEVIHKGYQLAVRKVR